MITQYKIFEKYNAGDGEYAEFDNDNGESFWGNLAAGVLPYCEKTQRVLLNYRSEYVNEPHTWGIWGGKLDGDEDIKDAVIREFYEESNFNDDIKLIDAFIFKSGGGFEYYNFIGIIENEFTPELDWESENFKWVTIEELYEQDNLHFGLETLLKESKNIIENL